MFLTLEQNSLSLHPSFMASEVARSLDEMPLGFIDVGARGGVHDMVEPLAGKTAVLGFEPDEDECARLLATKQATAPWARFALDPIALANAESTATLHLLSAATNHSLLPPNEAFTKRYDMVKFEEVGTAKLKTATLDSILFGPRADEPFWGEFMKLDTQGTEYEILEGATNTLTQRCVAVVTEVSFCEIYKGQKLFSEVEQLMRGHGFSFYGFMPIHTRSKKLLNKRTHITVERALYTDAVFFKDPLSARGAVALSRRHQHVLFTVALLLGFLDFALEVAHETWLQDAPHAEQKRITELVYSLAELPPAQSARDVEQLVQQVKAAPELANVCVGAFVDRRRRMCDFDDVLNISPLPKTL